MDNFSCRHCDVALTIEGAPSGRACRCASCGELNFFIDGSLKLPRQTLAWQSFWLSIVTLLIMVVAFVLLFADYEWTAGMLGPVAVIFGSFAAYWGIKALLRTRYQKAPPSAKVAATSAALLGGCSGVCLGGMFACVFVSGLLLSYFSVETKDPVKVQQIASQYFEVDLPEQLDFVPADADSNPFISNIEYWDDKEFGKSKVRIYVSWMGAMFTTGFGANNRNQLATGSLRRIMGGQRRFVESGDTKILVWTINGEEVDVKKVHWQRRADADQSGDTFITYQGLTDTESTTYCLTLLCKTPAERLSDQQVKSIFESFDPID